MDESDRRLHDRLAIDDTLTRYATAIDARNWGLLDSVFLEDAELDYRSAGGVRGRYPEVRTWLSEVLPIFTWTQHLVVNREIEVDGSGARASARSVFHNPNQLLVDGQPWLFTVGGYYHDQFVRTAIGWRIAVRVEETSWWANPMPGLPSQPYPMPVDSFS